MEQEKDEVMKAMESPPLESGDSENRSFHNAPHQYCCS